MGLRTTELAGAAKAGGASHAEFFGDYRESPYDEYASTDLIMIARKGGENR